VCEHHPKQNLKTKRYVNTYEKQNETSQHTHVFSILQMDDSMNTEDTINAHST